MILNQYPLMTKNNNRRKTLLMPKKKILFNKKNQNLQLPLMSLMTKVLILMIRSLINISKNFKALTSHRDKPFINKYMTGTPQH